MEILLNLIFIYIAVYSLYYFVLSLRNLNKRTFTVEQDFDKFEDRDNFAVVVYSHNNKSALEMLINQFKQQDYPIDRFKIFVILDNCNDGSETIFRDEKFVNVVKFNQTLGKDRAISLLLDQLQQDRTIDSYVFIDGNRAILSNFLTIVNSGLVHNNVLCGETLLDIDDMDIVDSIKAIYQKYSMNFTRQARSLLGLATEADSGVFVIRKKIVDKIGIDFKNQNSELRYSLLLSKIGCRCTYNPNIKTYVNSEAYVFKRQNISKRLQLFLKCLKEIRLTNFVFTEHVFSLIQPNFWLCLILYAIIIKHSYKYYFFVDFNVVLFSFIIWLAGFGISLISSNLRRNEFGLLALYPFYSVGHIIKNLPLLRLCFNRPIHADDRFIVNVVVQTQKCDLPCKLEFIDDNGIAKIKFSFKNKRYVTSGHLRVIDALQELKTKLDDYGFTLKICNCCSHFETCVDGSTNMIRGFCRCDYPSPALNEQKQTLIWNTCLQFSPSQLNSQIAEIINSKID